MSIIYKIYNDIDNIIYIGSTDNYNRRKSEHFNLLKNKIHHCWRLQKAYNNLGKEVFNIEKVEETTKEYRYIIEQHYINLNSNHLYNTELIVNERSEESKIKVGNKLRTFNLSDLKKVLNILINNTKISVTDACENTNLNVNKLYYTVERGFNKSILDNETVQLIRKYKTMPRLHKPLNSRVYFKDPKGNIYEVTKSMLSFCTKHKLNNSNMCQVKRGNRKSCQGWTLVINNEGVTPSINSK